MKKSKTYLIFGFGSLMSEESHTKTVGENHTDHGFYTLSGYERVFNACYQGSVYLNIQTNQYASTIGNIIEITEEGFDALKKRESGYDLIDISDSLDFKSDRPVYTCFIPNVSEISGTIKQSYINKCWVGLDQSDREQWLLDSIVLTPIEQDETPLEN